MRIELKRIAITWNLMGLCWLANPCFAGADDVGQLERVIAVVDGKAIYEKDIAAQAATIERRFERTEGRRPSAEEVAREVNRVRREKLVTRIDAIIRQASLQDLGVNVTEDEVRSEIARNYPGLAEQPSAVLAHEQEYFRDLSQALKEFAANPEEDRAIFERQLQGRMVYETWQAVSKRHSSTDDIARIEGGAPETVEDIYKDAGPTTRAYLEEMKLREAVVRAVAVGDDEARERLESLLACADRPQPLFDKTEEYRRMLDDVKRMIAEGRWRREQYRKYKVEIDCATLMELLK